MSCISQPHAQDPGQAETDRCTHLDCLTHAHFLPGIYTVLRVGFFFFFLNVVSSRTQKAGVP